MVNLKEGIQKYFEQNDRFIKSEEIIRAYNNKEQWGKMSLVNIAKSGFFAADRSIKEYADNIWHLTSLK